MKLNELGKVKSRKAEFLFVDETSEVKFWPSLQALTGVTLLSLDS